MKDYTKEMGHPDGWSDEDKERLVEIFRKVPVMAQLSDKKILEIAAEHWKFQNGEELEGAVTLKELEDTIRRNRKPRRPARTFKPKP